MFHLQTFIGSVRLRATRLWCDDVLPDSLPDIQHCILMLEQNKRLLCGSEAEMCQVLTHGSVSWVKIRLMIHQTIELNVMHWQSCMLDNDQARAWHDHDWMVYMGLSVLSWRALQMMGFTAVGPDLPSAGYLLPLCSVGTMVQQSMRMPEVPGWINDGLREMAIVDMNWIGLEKAVSKLNEDDPVRGMVDCYCHHCKNMIPETFQREQAQKETIRQLCRYLNCHIQENNRDWVSRRVLQRILDDQSSREIEQKVLSMYLQLFKGTPDHAIWMEELAYWRRDLPMTTTSDWRQQLVERMEKELMALDLLPHDGAKIEMDEEVVCEFINWIIRMIYKRKLSIKGHAEVMPIVRELCQCFRFRKKRGEGYLTHTSVMSMCKKIHSEMGMTA